MNYSNIKYYDVSNGLGVRISLFVSGCRHHCKNCFNQETWDFKSGYPFTEETEEEILTFLEKPYIRGLSLLGGEPTEPENQKVLVGLMRKFKEKFPNKDLWVWTGTLYETLLNENSPYHTEYTEEFLSYVDYLIDGQFIEELKGINLDYKGSSNQRLIDMKKTREKGDIVLYDIR